MVSELPALGFAGLFRIVALAPVAALGILAESVTDCVRPDVSVRVITFEPLCPAVTEIFADALNE